MKTTHPLGLIELGLRPQGLAATSVGSGDEALRVLAEREADLLITDLNMPGMKGIELCERVAERYPDVPVLIVTAVGFPARQPASCSQIRGPGMFASFATRWSAPLR